MIPALGQSRPVDNKLLFARCDLDEIAVEMERADRALPERINAGPDDVERGLAQLVLTLIELLRRLLERQALHRIDSGAVTDEEIERLGDTFQKLEARMGELKEVFGLADEDLNLNLGPLGDLM